MIQMSYWHFGGFLLAAFGFGILFVCMLDLWQNGKRLDEKIRKRMNKIYLEKR